MSSRPLLAIYGGSFDPVHKAHVAVVKRVQEVLKPKRFHLVPCHVPPHKAGLHASHEHRLAMLASVFNTDDVYIDERELSSPNPSYTVETLAQLRQEVGEEWSLCFVMGGDSWRSFGQWYRWQRIVELANVVVLPRHEAGGLPDSEVAQFYSRNHVEPETLAQHAAGKVCEITWEAMDISSSGVRQRVQNSKNISGLVPEKVAGYIQSHRLYC